MHKCKRGGNDKDVHKTKIKDYQKKSCDNECVLIYEWEYVKYKVESIINKTPIEPLHLIITPFNTLQFITE